AAVALEPELAPRYLPALGEALGAALEAFLEERVAAVGEAAAGPYELALALHRRSRGEVEAALGGLRRLVERQPRLWEARKELGALLLSRDSSEELRADYQEILGTLGQPVLGFACGWCGQRLPEHVFRCPACEGWGAVRREELPPARP
ncbi:MAG TPA: hypothetical protein VK447_02965, partial [Myxococcaceae bacterium]|nr:hypothetical protein [Myxococcaceae bacterium]